jgi:hypothetical protein
MTPKQRCVEDMIFVGAQMANLCFNLAQARDDQIGKRNAEIMDSLHRQWDSSVREYRKLTKKKQRAGQ